MTPAEFIRHVEAGSLSQSTINRLNDVLQLADFDLAIADAANLINTDAKITPWKCAGELARRLRHFEATAWPRIKNGYREPRSALEVCFCKMLACGKCPTSQGRLFARITSATAEVNII